MIIRITDNIISPYGICMGSAFVISFYIAFRILKRADVPTRIIRLSILMNVVFVLLGGKLYTVLISGDSNINIWNSTFSSVGGLIGMIVGIEVFNVIYEQKKNVFRNAYVLIVPLLYSVSKIGCLLSGCCYGIPYNGIGSILYVNDIKDTGSIVWESVAAHIPGYRVFPVQLVETIVFALIFILGYLIYNKWAKNAVPYVLLLGAAGKFWLEYYRWDNIDNIININQIICLLLFVVTIIFILYKGRINGKQL